MSVVHASRFTSSAATHCSRAWRAVSSPPVIANGRPSSPELHTALAVARTTVSASSASCPVEYTVTSRRTDVDPPCRMGRDPQGVCRVVQRPQIGADVRGARLRVGAHHLRGGADAGEHQHAGQPGGVGPGDVGVQTVPDHQRAAELPAGQGVRSSASAPACPPPVAPVRRRAQRGDHRAVTR